MCILTPESALNWVSNTQIFARHSTPGRQQLVYRMTVSARDTVAMILPIPTPPGAAEDAVGFIDLEAYPGFFDDLENGFPMPRTTMWAKSDDFPVNRCLSVLEVHDVGLFEASFVPSQADFTRLDPRFRIPTAVWAKMPQYDDYGFAVFQLKSLAAPEVESSAPPPESLADPEVEPITPPPPVGWFRRLFGAAPRQTSNDEPPTLPSPKTQTIHPMAFEFPTRSANQLFFPTVHVHDGQVHDEALFRHKLYCQLPESGAPVPEGWERSTAPAADFMQVELSQGLIEGGSPCLQRILWESGPNKDYVLEQPREGG